MNHDYEDDDQVAETHRQAAALLAALLMAETEHEHELALRQAATMTPYLGMLTVGSLAGIVKDLLDAFDWDEYDRLEWIAQRVDVIAERADQ